MRCTRMLGRNFQFRISQRVISNIKSIFSYIKFRLTRKKNTRRDVYWSHAANVKTSWSARRMTRQAYKLQVTSYKLQVSTDVMDVTKIIINWFSKTYFVFKLAVTVGMSDWQNRLASSSFLLSHGREEWNIKSNTVQIQVSKYVFISIILINGDGNGSEKTIVIFCGKNGIDFSDFLNTKFALMNKTRLFSVP
jgi:hypothetical protein